MIKSFLFFIEGGGEGGSEVVVNIIMVSKLILVITGYTLKKGIIQDWHQ